MGQDLKNATPKQALLTMRIIWGAMLMGEIAFLTVLMTVVLPARKDPPNVQRVLVITSAIMLATVIPVAFFVRSAIFNRARTEGGIPAGPYATGNIIFWAACEGTTFFALVAALLNGSLAPTVYFAAVAIAVQVTAFPSASKLAGTLEG
jgi:hypothetical protein